MKKRRHSAPSAAREARIPTWSLIVPALVTVAALAMGAFMPGDRLWGLNHLAFYPLPLRLAVLAVMVAALLPAVGRLLHRGARVTTGYLRSRPRIAAAAVVLIALAALYAFFSLQASTLLLGDGQLTFNELKNRFPQDSTHVASVVELIAKSDRINPGTSTAYYLSAVAVKRVLGAPILNGIILLNCVLGTILIAFLLWIVLRGSLPDEMSTWLLGLAVGSGVMQLFFGYVENYTPLIFLGALYVISTMALLHGRGGLWLPVVTLVLAIVTHVEGLLLVPSFVFLLVWKVARRRRDLLMRFITPALLVLTLLGAYVAGAHTGLSRFFLPVAGGAGTYSVLSPAHWADIANELFLLLPMWLVLAVSWVSGSLAARRAQRDVDPWQPEFKSPADGTHDEWWFALREDRHLAYLILAPCVLYLLFFNPEIGMSRDWDLFSILILALLPLGLIGLRRALAFAADPGGFRVLVTGVLFGGVLITCCWIGINASPRRSTARFEKVLEYDRAHVSYAYENLARCYYEQSRLADAIRIMEICCEESKNPRQMTLLALYYQEYNDMDAAVRTLQMVLDRWPRNTYIRRQVAMAYLQSGRFAELEEVARGGVELYPDFPIYYYLLGKSLVELGRAEEGRKYLEESKARGNKDPAMLEDINRELERLNRGD